MWALWQEIARPPLNTHNCAKAIALATLLARCFTWNIVAKGFPMRHVAA